MGEGIWEVGDCVIEIASQSEMLNSGGKVVHGLGEKAPSCVGFAKAAS